MNLRAPLAFVLVLAAAVAVYFRAPSVGFLSDEFYLPLLVGADGADFGQVLRDLTGPWLSVEGSPSYRPGITLHYAIDAALFGWNPLGFHASNVLLHALNAALVFALGALLWRETSPWCWCLAGLVFALHPAAAEAVCWISGRVDTTTAFPYLLSLVLLARWSHGGGTGWLVGALASGGASLLCKESAITLPVSFAFVDAVVRRRRPSMAPVLAALALAGGYLALRAHALGSPLAGAGAALDPQGIARSLAEKLAVLVAPAAPKDSPRWVALLHPLLFGALPVLLSLRNPVARRFLPLCVIWCCALVLPAYQVPLTEGYGGTRVVYLALVPYSLLVGRALGAKRRSLVHLVAAAALLALGALLTDGRNRVHVAATRLVRGHQEWVLAQEPSVRGRGLFLADIAREIGGVTAFRYDNAYLAFRRPFLPVDVPVYVGSNMAVDWVDDTTAVQVAFRAGMEVQTFEAEQGARFEPIAARKREDLALPLDEAAASDTTMSERGLELPGARPGWLLWEARTLEPAAFEGASLVLTGGAPDAPELSWRPETAEPLPEAVERALEQLCRTTFSAWRTAGGSTRFVAPLGNRAGWTFAYRFRSPMRIRLAVPPGSPVAVREVSLLGRLPGLEVPPAPQQVDLAEPLAIPVGAAPGHFRLVLLTPMQVLEEFATDPPGAITLSVANQKLLRLVARLAPGTRIHYVVDRLARPRPDRASTLERSEARSFELK